jgi:hypothetical protein
MMILRRIVILAMLLIANDTCIANDSKNVTIEITGFCFNNDYIAHGILCFVPTYFDSCSFEDVYKGSEINYILIENQTMAREIVNFECESYLVKTDSWYVANNVISSEPIVAVKVKIWITVDCSKLNYLSSKGNVDFELSHQQKLYSAYSLFETKKEFLCNKYQYLK